mgnify:CR=1 FL=1
MEKRSKFILLQDDPFKRFWNVLIILLLLYVATYVPYDICFQPASELPYNFFKFFDLFVDGLFFIDIIVNFLSSYDDVRGLPVIEPKLIAKNYITGWFSIDFVACFPT